MIRAFVRHAVEDYDAWRKVYDEFAKPQEEGGVESEAVFRGLDDPNNVTVVHDFDTEDEARAFFSSDELKQAMGEAGVSSPPDIWFTREV